VGGGRWGASAGEGSVVALVGQTGVSAVGHQELHALRVATVHRVNEGCVIRRERLENALTTDEARRWWGGRRTVTEKWSKHPYTRSSSAHWSPNNGEGDGGGGVTEGDQHNSSSTPHSPPTPPPAAFPPFVPRAPGRSRWRRTPPPVPACRPGGRGTPRSSTRSAAASPRFPCPPSSPARAAPSCHGGGGGGGRTALGMHGLRDQGFGEGGGRALRRRRLRGERGWVVRGSRWTSHLPSAARVRPWQPMAARRASASSPAVITRPTRWIHTEGTSTTSCRAGEGRAGTRSHTKKVPAYRACRHHRPCDQEGWWD
jgi:hypothetical protein